MYIKDAAEILYGRSPTDEVRWMPLAAWLDTEYCRVVQEKTTDALLRMVDEILKLHKLKCQGQTINIADYQYAPQYVKAAFE